MVSETSGWVIDLSTRAVRPLDRCSCVTPDGKVGELARKSTTNGGGGDDTFIKMVICDVVDVASVIRVQ